MKKYGINQIRNIALVSHGGSGKTSLAEAMLFNAGAIDRLGRVDDGNATMDYDPEEIKRKISISAGLAPCGWNNHKINIIDTPGYFDFVGEVKGALRVVESAIVMMDAVAGVEVGTEMTWRYAEESNVRRVLFINKMDRENANFERSLQSAVNAFESRLVPVILPIGAEAKFRGVVDLLTEKAYLVNDGKVTEAEVPADMAEAVADARLQLIEAAAESDDEMLMKYLEGEELTKEEVIKGLRQGILAGKIVPVASGSATKNIGIQRLMELIVNFMPSPADAGPASGTTPDGADVTREPNVNAPFSAFVFKTMADPYVGKLTIFRVYSGLIKSDTQVYNVSKQRSERVGQLFVMKGKNQEAVAEIEAGDIGAMAKLQETTTGDTFADENNPIIFSPIQYPKPVFSVAALPKAKGDEDKIGSGLHRLTEEDPTLQVHKDPVTAQLILSGMGDMQLDVVTDRLSRKFGVSVNLESPKVAYKETIRNKVNSEYKHKKQSGGRGQYGHVVIEIEPLADAEFEFVDKIFGGAVPRQYIPAVEKGLRETLVEGVVAGYPVTNVRVTLLDGSYHAVDSSEMAFKLAASQAFKKGMAEARPVLLEPIYSVQVTIPQDYMGDVIGDLNKKRGKVLGMESMGNSQIIKALVPLAEMAKYAIDLRSITQGRGTFTMEFAHYEEVPANVAQQVIEEAKKAREEENK